MPSYSDEVIEEVRNQNDIVDVIGQYVSLQKKGRDYFGICPFHNEKTGSFSVSQQKQMYYCFGCHASGNVYTFLRQYENFTFVEAVQALADRVGYQLPVQELSAEQRARADKRSRLLEVNKEAANYFYKLLRSDHGKDAMAYFEGRKLTADTMKKFGLGYSDKYSNDLYNYLKSKGYDDKLLVDSALCSISEQHGGRDIFWNRAMFPIMDHNSKVVAFGGRVMGEGEPKYLNSRETDVFNKSRTLYGLHIAKHSRSKSLILCEGYMDVISLHQAGFDYAVASLGTALTSEHARTIQRYVSDVYLCYDSDKAGVNAALRAFPILRDAGVSCSVIDMTPYKDPDEFIKALGAEEFQKRIDEAKTGFYFYLYHTGKKYKLKDPGEITRFQHEVVEFIANGYEDQIERENYLRAYADEYKYSYDGLWEIMVKYASSGGIISKAKPLPTAAKKEKDDGTKVSERLLLTWLVESPRIYPIVSKYIQPSDFSEGLFNKVAVILYQQFEENGTPNPSAIVDCFIEEDEQKEIGRMFNSMVDGLEDNPDKDKALKETLIRIKRNSIDTAGKTGKLTLKETVENKKLLQSMESMAIHL